MRRKCGPRPARTRRWTISATWRRSIRSSRPARRSAAKCRRSAASAASRSSKTWPSSCAGRTVRHHSTGRQFVILKCEGRTEPVEVNQQEVRDILYQDIFEKKLRIAMGEKFEEIRTQARIDNFLAGTSQSPDRVKTRPAATSHAPRVDSAVRPTAGHPVAGRGAMPTRRRHYRAGFRRRLRKLDPLDGLVDDRRPPWRRLRGCARPAAVRASADLLKQRRLAEIGNPSPCRHLSSSRLARPPRSRMPFLDVANLSGRLVQTRPNARWPMPRP